MADPGPIGSANIGAAAAIFDNEGRVLLVKHTYGRFNWEIPGGISLPGEPPFDGARREVSEETGLILADGEFSGVYYEPGHDFGPMLHFVFRFVWDGKRDPVAQPPEIGQLGWFALGELPVPMSDFTEQRIRDALAGAAVYRMVAGRKWRE
jgi:8-oxo-dGTP diphosphatase